MIEGGERTFDLICKLKVMSFMDGPLLQAFFFTVAKKLKAKKTQAMKKLKHFFGQKLKLPEDFSKFAAKNSSYRRIFQNFRPKTPSNRQINCPKSLVNYVFWCKIDFKHQKTLKSNNFTEKINQFLQNSTYF